jgi:hypothetical protein
MVSLRQHSKGPGNAPKAPSWGVRRQPPPAAGAEVLVFDHLAPGFALERWH